MVEPALARFLPPVPQCEAADPPALFGGVDVEADDLFIVEYNPLP